MWADMDFSFLSVLASWDEGGRESTSKTLLQALWREREYECAVERKGTLFSRWKKVGKEEIFAQAVAQQQAVKSRRGLED